MWVTRNKDNSIALWRNKPYRSLNEWKSKYEGTEYPFYLLEDNFPYLNWEDEPEEVTISLKNPLYKITCPYCGKEMTYHLSDIKHSYDYQPSSDYSDEWNYIVCPDCNKEVKIN